MSLWTPDGERPVNRPSAHPEAAAPDEPELSPEEAARAEELVHELAEARQRLLEAPVSTVLVNHALGIYELAALHLTADEPDLVEAQLAIDALGGLVDAASGRLGEQEQTVREALHQLRLAFVQRGRQDRPPSGSAGS
jgi:hypothetical protein